MTIGAVLHSLELSTPQPPRLAAFYRKAFLFDASGEDAPDIRCQAASRVVLLRPGEPNQLVASEFRFASAGAMLQYASRLETTQVPCLRLGSEDESVLSVLDPEGRAVRFSVEGMTRKPLTDGGRDARLQHYAVRTPEPERLVEFYTGKLGFVTSDLVKDEQGVLRAAFLRTDAEHHALAIFRGPEARFDHFSCEVPDWGAVRDWADHMASENVELAWGVGRHGPGNDTFFMVADPDGNLAEISSDLEVCADDRVPGVWPHHPSTLNRWGMAIMRS